MLLYNNLNLTQPYLNLDILKCCNYHPLDCCMFEALHQQWNYNVQENKSVACVHYWLCLFTVFAYQAISEHMLREHGTLQCPSHFRLSPNFLNMQGSLAINFGYYITSFNTCVHRKNLQCYILLTNYGRFGAGC